jgi:predicted nucleic acid-binding protein
MKLVVDTSILIDYLRGGDRWAQLVREMKDEGEYYIPTIVIFELFSERSSKEQHKSEEIQEFITRFQQIQLTESIATRAGKIFRDITKNIDIADYIIASSALEINGTVVTLNKKHFQQIPLLSIYPL